MKQSGTEWRCGAPRAVWLLLLAAAVAACSCARQPNAGAPAEPLRAMTFNIRYGTAPDSANAWPNRRALTFRVIRDAAPHVLGVQEALRFQLDEIERLQPHFGEVGVGRDDGVAKGEYSAILYDQRRLEVLERSTFWLSDTPRKPGSMTWGNRFPRIVTWARFRERTGSNATFYVFNTHWDHESQQARARGAAMLLDSIRSRRHRDDAVLVMGDFNAGEDNPAFKALLTATSPRLYDTFRAVRPNARETGTFHGFRGDRSGPRIDAILATPTWHTLAANIILLSENGVYPSDHYPVTATLVLYGR